MTNLPSIERLWELNLTDRTSAENVVSMWGNAHRTGEDPTLNTFSVLVMSLNRLHPDMVVRLMDEAFSGSGCEPLTSRSRETLTDVVRNIPLDVHGMKGLISAVKRGGEHPRFLLPALIRGVLSDQTHDRLDGLEVLVEELGVNTPLAYDHGEGPPLFHAINLTYRLHPDGFDRLEQVVERLGQCGAHVHVACEDTEGGVRRGKHATLLDWVGQDLRLIQWWAAPTLDMLISAGYGWGTLDQRDDAVGRQVRNHPAWRRDQLGNRATPERAAAKPKAL